MTAFLIDVTRLLYRSATRSLPTGIDRVAQRYVRRYGANARAALSLGPFSVALSPRDSARAFEALAGRLALSRPAALVLIAKAFLWRWLALDVRGQWLVNASHTGLENANYGWWLRRRGARLLVVVHDLIPLTHPEFCRPQEPRRHAVRMRCAARHATAIVANSQHTLDAFGAFCRDAALASPRSVVARLGAGLAPSPPGPRPMAEPYFVVLGTIEARKNHVLLLHLWRRLAASLGTAAPRLVVIGRRGWECENVVDLLERSEAIRGLVIEQAGCDDAELVTWLHHSRALLFPSFAEGYGLPLCEALALGVPVIASNLDAFREIAGDIPDYAAPIDGARWEALVRDYAQAQSALREAQLQRLRDFEPPTWEQHFARVDALLAQAPG